MLKKWQERMRQWDWDKLRKNVIGAILGPAGMAFGASHGNLQATLAGAKIGVVGAVLILVGFAQNPYRRGTPAHDETPQQ